MIELNAGQSRLILDPETGGAIAALTHGGVELLRPVTDPRLAAQHGRPIAGYPLIPFANRVADGRFAFGGRIYQLALNFGDHPHTIHGNAWMRRWHRVSASAGAAHLALDHAPPGDPASEWPFAYRAEQIFTLTEAGLRIEMSVRNVDSVAWPAGLGLHPYVARAAGTTLRFSADTVWRNGPDGLPVAREAVAHRWDFAAGRALDASQIDECYAGWGGLADITWPQHGLTMRLTAGLPLDHVQLYTPPGLGFFGLEPVSNMPDAINRIDAVADQGLRVLAPGEVLGGTIELMVERLG